MAMEIVNTFKIFPSKGAPSGLFLPLLHSDQKWLPSYLSKTLFFYHVRFSESSFHHYVVPKLKNSLSFTLKHFPSLASKLVFPLCSGKPYSQYSRGDSVALIIAQSGADFQRLTGGHNFIGSDELDDFVPHLPPPTYLSHQIVQPATAIQITFFPNFGISIGLNIHPAIADLVVVDRFVRTWALTNKLGFRNEFRSRSHYNWGVASDADRLIAKYFDRIKMSNPASPAATYVEARFTLTKAIEKILIKFLLNREEPATASRDSSTFVVASAYIWCCLAMSAASAGDMVSDNEPEFLALALDNYHPNNNCSTPVLVKSTHGALKRKGCFVAAAEAISEALSRRSSEGSRNFSMDLSDLAGDRKLVVGGSPAFDAYGVDYGWGRPEMFTSLTNKQVHICKSRDGGVEIVMWNARAKMEAFAAIFDRGVEEVEDLHILSSL